MSNVIKLKNNNILGTIPTTSDLEAGELAINTASGRLYTEINDNEIVEVGPHPVFDTIAEAETYFPLVGDICYINETSSNYKYVEYISDPPTVNEKNILITGQGGNTRWIATILSTTVAPLLKFFVGMTIEEPDSVITSDGTTVTLTLQAIGSGDITYSRPDGSIDVFDCTPAQTISLTPGTDTNYIQNWFYIDSPTNTLVANTTGFPTTEHVKLGNVILQSAATIQSEGKVRGGHNYSDHVFSPLNNGHGSHTNHAFRVRNGVYLDGLDFSHFGSGTATLNIGIATGKITQAHDHDTPTFASGSDFIIVNQSFDIENNLYNITTDADNNTNINRYAAYFIFIVFYEGGSNIYINKPSETYLNEADAIEGVVYDYPSDFRGTMYPVHVLVARRGTSSITIYNDSSVDMRGKIVDAIAGGGSGIVPSHGDNHVNGTDDVPLVTDSVKGLMPPNDQATELSTTGSPKFVKVSGSGGVGGNLVLESTPDPTKGKIYLGANSVYDEANDRLGINTTSPSEKLEVNGNIYLGNNNSLIFNSSGGLKDRMFAPIAGVAVEENLSRKSIFSDTNNNNAVTDIMYEVIEGGSYSGGGWTRLMAILKNGNVGFSVNSPTARIHAKGSTSDSSAYALKVDDSSDSSLFSIRNDGTIGIGPEDYVTIKPPSLAVNGDTVFILKHHPLQANDSVSLTIKEEDGDNLLRILGSWPHSFIDDAPTAYFQTGINSGNSVFSAYAGTLYNRIGFIVSDAGPNTGLIITDKASDIAIPVDYVAIIQQNNTRTDFAVDYDGTVKIPKLHTYGPRIVNADADAAITGDYTVLNTDKEILYGNPTGSDKDWTLPASPTENGKRTYVNASDTYSMIVNGGEKKVAGFLDPYTIGPGLSETFHYTTAFGHTRI